jgi:hypothetical protein
MAGERLMLQLHPWDVEHDHGALGDPNVRPYGNGALKEPRLSENDPSGYTVVLTSALP